MEIFTKSITLIIVGIIKFYQFVISPVMSQSCRHYPTCSEYSIESIKTVVESPIKVFAQNLETVERLTHPIRDPRAGYQKTLTVLKKAKELNPNIITKSSIILGMGETDEEINKTFEDLRLHEVDIVTLGQYLRPTLNHLPIDRWVTPDEFEKYRKEGLEYGFKEVVSGPFVRSSYRAERALELNNVGLA